MSILISNVIAVTMCDDCPIIENAYIATENNRISYVGTERPVGNFEKEIDGTNMVVMPGLVNAHTHTAMTILRSYADDMNLQDWLFNKIFPFEDTLTPEMVYEASVKGMAEMVSTGTTCFNDMYFFQEETADAAEKLGMRGVLNEGITDGVLEKKIEKTQMLIDKVKRGSGRLKVGVSPHAVYTCSNETLKKCAEFAKENNLRIHTHLSETITENNDCERDFKVSPTVLMDKMDLFNMPTTAAHCVFLSDNDIEIIKNKNVSVVHNPISNLKLASGVAEIPKLMANGVNVALGTDGASSNNNLDMFEEMKVAGILHKGVLKDPTVLPAYDVLKMATVNGAKALGYDDLGQLKKGFLADMILLDFDRVEYKPNHNTISNLVYACNGRDVIYAIIDGNVVYSKNKEKRKFSDKQVDIEEFLK